MAIHKLSARKVETAPAGKYEDGGGLRLVVSASGARKWVFRYTLSGKRREMGLLLLDQRGVLGKMLLRIDEPKVNGKWHVLEDERQA